LKFSAATDGSLPEHAAMLESARHLEQAMATLSLRLRQVTEGIRDGKSYREIGASLGISKQAAHTQALQTNHIGSRGHFRGRHHDHLVNVRMAGHACARADYRYCV